MKKFGVLVVLALLIVGVLGVQAQDVVELRIAWYDDGNEGTVLRDLLDRFEAENPDIKVIVDTVPYQTILDQLPLQVEAGEAPDMARVTAGERYRGFYLDLRPYVADPAYWDASFPAAVLQWLREPGEESDALYGFPNQFTVTGPFINRTLFEQAGVDVPSDSSDAVTWQEWTDAAAAVAEATGVNAIAIDRSGHRVAGPAFSSGATFFAEDGTVTIDTPGFRTFAQLLLDWHTNSLTPAEIWVGSGGTYAAGAPFFISGELAVYMSGSWQISNFATNIGDAFDWEAVPNPTGEGGSTGMPGGTAFVAFAQTEHPEEVARVMDYLASADVYREFSERTLFIPAHQNLGELNYQTELPAAQQSLQVFAAEALKLSDQAYRLQYEGQAFAINNPIRDRLTQAITGELTLDDAIARIQEDVDAALAAAAAS
ncbi:MAG: extracellular solute-binding protein [Chloroflexi bacterium]|uniref:ABC transporter substrate-binding protein n=1 Tax=Candidatus Flexifilum breve TaxID=3140694 RepID=UPI0031349231|nr:extracellular solute-binding protein [Chloroflexota bacterium]MBK9749566.1 extracellular solute-binding protein [Chloroflexota bacterium]